MSFVTVQGAMQLAAPAAVAWARLVEDVRADTGVTLTISSPGGAFRSPEMVLDMWRNPAKYGATKGTAKPRSLGGPGSVHENGLCVDIWNWAAVGTKRLDQYAAAHGFRRTISTEPWHYQHNGIMPAGGGKAPFDPRKGKEKMLHFYTEDGPAGSNGLRYHILHSGGVYTYTSGGSSFPNAVAAEIGNAIKTDAAFIEAMKRQHREQNPSGGAGGGTFDTAPIVAAVEKNTAALSELLKATKALNPPG
jgi:hypothetical protein